jgi:hypothetical protein
MTITVQAFVLCNSVRIDETSRNTDILGVFDIVLVKRFPATHTNCAVYARLHLWDEPGASLSIAMETPEMTKRQLLAPMEAKPDLNGRVKLICRIERLALPKEGIYTLQLAVNGKTRSEYLVTAVKRRSRPPSNKIEQPGSSSPSDDSG